MNCKLESKNRSVNGVSFFDNIGSCIGTVFFLKVLEVKTDVIPIEVLQFEAGGGRSIHFQHGANADIC